ERSPEPDASVRLLERIGLSDERSRQASIRRRCDPVWIAESFGRARWPPPNARHDGDPTPGLTDFHARSRLEYNPFDVNRKSAVTSPVCPNCEPESSDVESRYDTPSEVGAINASLRSTTESCILPSEETIPCDDSASCLQSPPPCWPA